MKRRRLARLARPARKDGFTAVEVLLAIGLFAMGAAGVLRMQKTSVQANVDVRMFDQATAIARTWTERFQRDATQWVPASPAGYGNAGLLSGTTINTADNAAWTVPSALVTGCTGACDGTSPYLDILGRDLAPANIADAIFCTNVRLTQMNATFLRAEVRVYWQSAMGGAIASPLCSAPPPLTLPATSYHAVYATTGIHITPAALP